MAVGNVVVNDIEKDFPLFISYYQKVCSTQFRFAAKFYPQLRMGKHIICSKSSSVLTIRIRKKFIYGLSTRLASYNYATATRVYAFT
jgi:hypothetical protein